MASILTSLKAAFSKAQYLTSFSAMERYLLNSSVCANARANQRLCFIHVSEDTFFMAPLAFCSFQNLN